MATSAYGRSKYHAPSAGCPLTVTLTACTNGLASVGFTLNVTTIGSPTPYVTPSPCNSEI